MGAGETKTLEFRLGADSFAIDSGLVRRVSRMREVVPCSRTGSPLTGLVKFKGQAVPVYDVETILGSHRCKETGKSKIIVAEGEQGTIAFIVDSVCRERSDFAVVDAGKALAEAHLI